MATSSPGGVFRTQLVDVEEAEREDEQAAVLARGQGVPILGSRFPSRPACLVTFARRCEVSSSSSQAKGPRGRVGGHVRLTPASLSTGLRALLATERLLSGVAANVSRVDRHGSFLNTSCVARVVFYCASFQTPLSDSNRSKGFPEFSLNFTHFSLDNHFYFLHHAALNGFADVFFDRAFDLVHAVPHLITDIK